MNVELDILFELDSSWFVEYYNNIKEYEFVSGVIHNSEEDSTINLSNFDKTQVNCIRKSVVNCKDDIINLNYISNQLKVCLAHSYESFSLLNEKMSNLPFKMDEINERFRKLQTRINNLKLLKRKMHLFLNDFILTPDQIKNIVVGQIDTNYINLLVKLKERLLVVNKDIVKTKVKSEIFSVYYSLKSIADHRICEEFISLIGMESENMFLYNSELHSKLIKKGELLEQLDKFGAEYIKLQNIFCNIVQYDLMRHTVGIIEELCNKKEKETKKNINSKEYDKFCSLFHERQAIINKIYLDTEDNLEKAICFLPKEEYQIEEIYFFSQRIIYKSFMEIYEISRQLFPSNKKIIVDSVFFDYLDKIMDVLGAAISNSTDLIGLSIIFGILFKYKTFLEAKVTVFDSGINDCEIIFRFYTKQSNLIYSLLENSIANHFDSLPLLYNREFIKLQKADELSHLYRTTRSLSEFLFVIIRLFGGIDGGQNRQAKKLISKCQQSLARWLKKNSNYLQSEALEFEKSCIYIINNVDLIISIFQDDDFTDIFGHMLNEYTQRYIEYRFKNICIDINKFLELQSHQFEICTRKIVEITENFHNNWKKNIDFELQQTLTSFSNFDTSEEILRLLGTTIAMKYSQFIDIVTANNECEKFIKGKIVSTEEILEYIQQCLYPSNH
ncbi:vacuolar sorting protein VPS52/suppressor of actin Sac2-family protein [Cryptosporidium ryanae]|uniref:vacuolar sorting protein VPS52/suppressor of actin Sac2-family protein n=1 Tax=Cryptosporidium ryanae TaxID=515981 RepID=UPI003519E796|nr:vacuolar sorting protein VPS52/suppressor of actin Sac2-family protein [Cryptosporidium ryanae]